MTKLAIPGRRARRLRVTAALVVPAAVLALAPTASGADPAPRTGSATAVLALPSLTVTLPDGSTRTVSLGSLSATATTQTTAFAALARTGASAAGLGVPDWTVDSSAGEVSGDLQLPVTGPGVTAALDLVGYDVAAGADTAGAQLTGLTATATATPVDAAVDLGPHGLASLVDGDHSAAGVTVTVTGASLAFGDLLPADLLGALPVSELVQLLDALGADAPAAALGLTDDLTDLTDLLADVDTAAGQLDDAQQTLAGLLAALPSTTAAQQTLGDAHDQLAQLTADLVTAQAQLATDGDTVQSLTDALTDATATVAADQQQVDDLTDSVDALTAQISAIDGQLTNLLLPPQQILDLTNQKTSLQQQLTATEAQLVAAQGALADDQAAETDAQTDLAAAQAAVAADAAAVAALQTQVDAAAADVDSAQAALDAIVATLSDAAVDAAQQDVTDLTATLTGLLGTVTDALSALPDLASVHDDLVDALAAVPLLSIGALGLTSTVDATDAGGVGTVDCQVSGVQLLGQPLPVSSCAALAAAFGTVSTAVHDALAVLPVSGVPRPTVDGLTMSTTGAAAAAADTVTSATASLSALHLAIAPLSLLGVTDAVIAGLHDAATAAVAGLGALAAPSLTAAAVSGLTALAGTTSSLPSGSALAGMQTLGVEFTLLGLTSTASHGRSLPAALPVGTGGTGGVGGSGGTGGGGSGGSGGGGGGGAGGDAEPIAVVTPPHSTPRPPDRHTVAEHAPTPALPFTGDTSAADAAAGLLLLLAGLHLVVLGRSRRA